MDSTTNEELRKRIPVLERKLRHSEEARAHLEELNDRNQHILRQSNAELAEANTELQITLAQLVAAQARLVQAEQLASLAPRYRGRPRDQQPAHDPADLGELDAQRYAGTTHVGKTGIERFYESQLHGEVGHERVETNAEGRVLRVLERSPPRPGDNVYLSIDARLQRATAAAMAGSAGAAVAIDPATGEVLAFVSVPSYDVNLFVNGISRTDYQTLLNAPGRPLFNRALQGGYEPGSTLKPFMALAGLELGVRDANYTIFSTGVFQIPGQI